MSDRFSDGSSEKTCLARAIQHLSDELNLLDNLLVESPFGRQEPYLKFIPGQNEHGPTTPVESGPKGKKLFGVTATLPEMLALQGNTLIIDEVLFEEKALKA